MEQTNWPKWLENTDFELYQTLVFAGYQDDRFTVLLKNSADPTNRKQLKLVWNSLYSHMRTRAGHDKASELHREKARPFYKVEESPYLSLFKESNPIGQEEKIYHFVIMGDEVLDILSKEEPRIELIGEESGLYQSFSEVQGIYIEGIDGQSRLGYALSDSSDFYDIPEIIEHQGAYKGAIIRFYDFNTGQVVTPFQLQENVSYGKPVFLQDRYYFLQADFTSNLVTLYAYNLDQSVEEITFFELSSLHLYNLRIMGKNLHVISHDDRVEVYYPYRKSFPLEKRESLIFIDDDKLFLSEWVEEGWDHDKDRPCPTYDYYEKLIIKDWEGNILFEERGCLTEKEDGSWWLS
ncbi:hypothetical protein ACVR1I_06345 [Streptococcus cameli]